MGKAAARGPAAPARAPAVPLKDQYGSEVVERIAAMIGAVHPAFPARAFVADAGEDYDTLELMARAARIAAALERHLPAGYPQACGILLRSLGPKATASSGLGLAPFLYLPHVLYVARCGLEHFELSMSAQYELTQRFSAEFSIRAFIERYPEKTLRRLARWARDPNEHVRRLVSEGTRPRLPWARRLKAFQADPRPVLALLELLKDDPSAYVRRSVANNLNDIGKDHPELLVETARRWLEGAGRDRRRLVAHALRSAVKRADPAALALLGYGRAPAVAVERVSIAPRRVAIGRAVTIALVLRNAGNAPCRVAADLRLHFVKANGAARAKVFKLRALSLPARASAALAKSISLAQLTTRRHYPGVHAVELILNGRTLALGHFRLVAAD